eukprot:COSAG01_NODE_1049_length_11922_cov_10.559587_1_plen_136_part_10
MDSRDLEKPTEAEIESFKTWEASAEAFKPKCKKGAIVKSADGKLGVLTEDPEESQGNLEGRYHRPSGAEHDWLPQRGLCAPSSVELKQYNDWMEESKASAVKCASGSCVMLEDGKAGVVQDYSYDSDSGNLEGYVT